jgi:hypothetical protein
MLPKKFTFYVSNNRDKTYTATPDWGSDKVRIVCDQGGEVFNSYKKEAVEYRINNGNWRIITCIDDEETKEEIVKKPALSDYSVKEAQAFCAATGAALLISENKFVLSHPGSGVSYCVPSVEDLQRAMDWLRGYLKVKEEENA